VLWGGGPTRDGCRCVQLIYDKTMSNILIPCSSLSIRYALVYIFKFFLCLLFYLFRVASLEEAIVSRNLRPLLTASNSLPGPLPFPPPPLPLGYEELARSCWHVDPLYRPPANTICKVLANMRERHALMASGGLVTANGGPDEIR
jgi:hypothetical protein